MAPACSSWYERMMKEFGNIVKLLTIDCFPVRHTSLFILKIPPDGGLVSVHSIIPATIFFPCVAAKSISMASNSRLV